MDILEILWWLLTGETANESGGETDGRAEIDPDG